MPIVNNSSTRSARNGTKDGPGRARTRLEPAERQLLAQQMPEIARRLAARRKSLRVHYRSPSRSPSRSSKRRRPTTLGGKKPKSHRRRKH